MPLDRIEIFLSEYNCSFLNLESTDTTMENAKNYVSNNCLDIVVLAEEQTDGRGRRGNKWISPKGNIYCSIALRNNIDINNYFFFNILTTISLQLTMEEFGIQDIKFKWPNDIFYKDKKLGGIILESYNYKNDINFVIIGLGINFLSSPQNINYPVTNLQEISSIDDRLVFFEKFLNNFFFNWINKDKNIQDLSDKFSKSLMFLNKTIFINKGNNEIISGIFKGINKDGSLILFKNQKLQSIYSGNIVI
tara:strand:- start:209 stop:955 length:747 start_codon:yes stop_codon:yes gene_type:complete